MECYNCGARLSENDFCNACGVDVGKYKKIVYASNRAYNEGLERANVRDLSGAISCLKNCLKLNKNHIEARNLLGLIYFETGEAVAGLSEWVISRTIREEKNIANDFIDRVQSNQGRLESITTTIRKYNKALELCQQDSLDLAVIQLKKVLSMNPKYLQAHKLLALIYIEKAEYEKARRELERTLDIDRGNTDALLYFKEVDSILDPSEDRRNKGIFNSSKDNSGTKTYKAGNEVIIQPINDREPRGITAFIQIGLGFLIGLCVVYFLIVPAKVNDAKENMNADIAAYGETIDKKNAEITEYESRVSELENDNISLRDAVELYEGADGAIDANNYLLTAAYNYMTDAGYSEVESALDLIGNDYLEMASYEYNEVYGYLLTQIGPSVAGTYYEEGIAYFNQMDYASAIRSLSKAYMYNPANDDALYYLALSYYESGDVNTATEKFNELIAAFPTSAVSDKARAKIDEINSNQL